MFAKQSNASKLAFIYLCQQQSIDIIDCQVYTEHLASLGAGFISGETYYEILQQQNKRPCPLKHILISLII